MLSIIIHNLHCSYKLNVFVVNDHLKNISLLTNSNLGDVSLIRLLVKGPSTQRVGHDTCTIPCCPETKSKVVPKKKNPVPLALAV